jgi:hypothetical protein
MNGWGIITLTDRTESHHLPAAFEHDKMRLWRDSGHLRTGNHPPLPECSKKKEGTGPDRFILYELLCDSQKILAVIDPEDKYPAKPAF